MAFYQGKAARTSLIDEIMAKLTTAPAGATDAYWKKVSSGTYQNEGYILKSTGASGTEKLFIRIKQPNAWGLQFSMMENYTPNGVDGLNGTILNESVQRDLCFYDYNTNGYPAAAPVYYWLSFDKDKIMLTLQADKLYSGWRKTFMYIGLPERMNAEPDSTAMVFGMSQYAHNLTGTAYASGSYGQYKKIAALKNRKQVVQPILDMRVLSKWKSRGWNNVILLGDIYLEEVDSGIRARMPHISPLYIDGNLPDYRDGDEITVGSRRFTIHRIVKNDANSENYNQNCFVSDWLAVEQLS